MKIKHEVIIMKIKTTLTTLCCAVLACTAFASTANAAKIGISMPTQSLQRWNQDGHNLDKQLKDAGHDPILYYAGDNDIPTQVSQIENLISANCDVLVVAPIDGGALTQALQGAKDKGIPVISYDRLIMNSDAISYYATFDNYKVGQIQGNYLVDALKLKDDATTPKNIEFFTGSIDDNNVNFFFGGAMDILQPYLDNGKLVCLSGQTKKEQVATLNWSTEEAQKRMENLIASNGYGPEGTRLDAILSSNDSVANGITNALVSTGYTPENFPILTGQDCDKPSAKNIKRGLQTMSIFKDTRVLADKVVEMVQAICDKKEVPVNDTKTYNNGTGIIPSYLCTPIVVTKDNLKEALIDSGYYTEKEIK